MDVPYKTVREAVEIIHDDDKLFCSLAEWFRNKGELAPNERDMTFWAWVYNRLYKMAGCIGKEPSEIKVTELVEALRVNSMGVALATECANVALNDGFKSHICCYVENGMVYASVYIGGKTSKEDEKRAIEIAAEFSEKGYATDVCIDEEDETDVTMNASIDFQTYLTVK